MSPTCTLVVVQVSSAEQAAEDPPGALWPQGLSPYAHRIANLVDVACPRQKNIAIYSISKLGTKKALQFIAFSSRGLKIVKKPLDFPKNARKCCVFH